MRSLTAMSASVTGLPGDLSQVFAPFFSHSSDSAPASRATPITRARSGASAGSPPGKGEPVDQKARGVGGTADFEVGSRDRAEEHRREIAGDRDFGDRIGALAVFEPEAGYAD